ncbi:carbohydrate ABC transporter permease [Paenibacillus sp. URB8-2]|uniref:carbohydrate ABC transporter permease n=1 Tax=Paenibacillus sp. URB8-2 TaxID=2741301 RepID=UPI0015C1F71E|nr:carbohydrate ABC transporter permease [Paenibacillus sp. URB8-2]BCG60954.1 sugar ABC transporter ATP-binding protein [Paenibacillus sp. URB8-2]
MSYKMQQKLVKLLMYVLLAIGVVISVYPFYWMFTASTLPDSEIFKLPPPKFPGADFIANLKALQEEMPIWRSLFNSLFVSSVTTVSTIFFASLAGYSFAKFRFKGRDTLLFIVLLTMMLPIQISLVPLFIIMTKLSLINSYYALILPYLVTGFGVFLMRQQLLAFPDELIESARIDGSGEFNTFLKIVLPTMKPACAALGIVMFMQQWGNFIWPLVAVSSEDLFTLPLMLSMMVEPGNVVQYGAVMVGAVIGLIPMILLFSFFQRFFVSGIFGGSVKG